MDSEQEIKLLEDDQRGLLKKRREIKETISELEARGRHIGYPKKRKNLSNPKKIVQSVITKKETCQQ